MGKLKPASRPIIGTFIDPLTDYGFKYLFGREPNKDLLIDFLTHIAAKRSIFIFFGCFFQHLNSTTLTGKRFCF